MSYILEFSETALADIKKHKKSGDKVVLKKIEKLDLTINDYLILYDIANEHSISSKFNSRTV